MKTSILGGQGRPGLIYVCDWLPPDFGAVGQYSLQFARNYAREGRDVVLIGLSSGDASKVAERHGDGHLTIVRLAAVPCQDKQRWGARLRWTVRTNLRLLRAVAAHVRGAREILFTGSPPFLLHVMVPANVVWRKRLVYRITDFHPECLMAALPRVPWTLRMFHRLTCALRRKVDAFQVLGLDQIRRLREIGIPEERITLERDPSPVAVLGDEAPLTPPAELAGFEILLYSGNWGVAHEVDTFVEGYIRHHREGSGRFGLWLNAVGGAADRVERSLRAAGVPIARTSPVPLELLPRLLVSADAHLITLKDAFVGYVMPSKVYGCIASRRPIVFIGSEASDVHLLCAQSGLGNAYLRVPTGDADGVTTALEAIPRRKPEQNGASIVQQASVPVH